MGETQTILKKLETSAKERMEKTKEMLKGLLNKEQTPEPESEQVENNTEDDE